MESVRKCGNGTGMSPTNSESQESVCVDFGGCVVLKEFYFSFLDFYIGVGGVCSLIPGYLTLYCSIGKLCCLNCEGIFKTEKSIQK